MKRIRISAGILALMIALSVFFNYRVTKQCEKLINLVELTEESVNSDDNLKALQYAEEFTEKWKRFRNEGAVMVRGDKISDVESCYIKIIPLLETENDELFAQLAELKNILIRIKTSELPTIYNIL